MIKKIALLVCILSFGNVMAQTTPQEIVDSFFKIYKTNEPLKALEDLYSHSPWLTDKNEGVNNLKTKFSGLKEHVGELYGYELLSTKNAQNTFVIITYLVKFNNNPITFTFEFYKPDKEWIVYSFSYDDSFVSEMEKSVREELFKSKTEKETTKGK
jgi:hypothetical protein